MPVFKYFAGAGSALLVLLFVSNAYLTDDESNLRFDGSLYGSALYAPRIGGAAELRLKRDVTPAVRVKGGVCRVRPQRAAAHQALLMTAEADQDRRALRTETIR